MSQKVRKGYSVKKDQEPLPYSDKTYTIVNYRKHLQKFEENFTLITTFYKKVFTLAV